MQRLQPVLAKMAPNHYGTKQKKNGATNCALQSGMMPSAHHWVHLGCAIYLKLFKKYQEESKRLPKR